MPTTGQLVQVIQTLQQKVHSLRSRQADLEALAATPATAFLAKKSPGHHNHRAGMKLPRPASFNGKRKKLQNFLSQLDVYALLAGQHWTEKDKVLHATMLLTGAAANWVQPYLCAAQRNQEVPMLVNYMLFMAKLTHVLGSTTR